MRGIRVGAALLVVAAALTVGSHVVHADPSPQNVVLILTDDQRWDAVQYMPNVESLLAAHGVTFSNAFDNNPLCCPTRTTIMTGLTSGHDGVWANTGANGGFPAFRANHDDQRQVFGWMHDAGYRTAMIGKFLNQYGVKQYKWVMKGVDDWQSFLLNPKDPGEPTCKTTGYFSTCYSNNGVLELHGPSEYSTTTSGQKAVDFIDSAPVDKPLFLYYAPRAPHGPTIPEAKYAQSCQSVPPIRPPSYNRVITGGPAYMTQLRKISPNRQASMDSSWVRACQTLLSVDDQVGAIVQALTDTGRLNNTLLVFASDNGFLFGEHRWKGKTVPYEQSIRVPVIVRDDSVIPPALQGSTNSNQITSLDYTPTFLQAAGLTRTLDGESLFPLIGGAGSWVSQDQVLIEHSEGAPGKGSDSGESDPPAYCGVREPGFMYARYRTGEEELYDLSADPNELTNVAGEASYAATLAALRSEAQQLCNPPPPGYTWQKAARGDVPPP